MLEKLHIDGISGQLGNGIVLGGDQRQRIEYQNGEMLNGDAAAMHRKLHPQSVG